jgi:hypothetical protein
MSNLQSFSSSTIESLKYYVYALVDISTNKICYIGKGQNQRVFESLKSKSSQYNGSLQAYIIRHSLTEEQSLMLEASLIDLLPYFSFSDLPFNYKDGIDNKETGIASIDDIENQYSSTVINAEDFKHNVLVISINRSVGLHDTLLTPVRLYECTRKAWRLNLDKAKKVDYVIAKHNGILKEIYKPLAWEEYPTEDGKIRYGFIGDTVIDANVREFYLNKKIDKRSYGMPLTYILNKDITTESE